MNTIPHTPGVYQILCVPTGKVYIGSTNDLRRRFCEHVSRLRRNCHTNLYLQSVWKKHGEHAFVFSVLEITDDYVACEQKWIDQKKATDRRFGLNIRPFADARTHSNETRQLIARGRQKEWHGFIAPDGTAHPPIINLHAFCKAHGLGFESMRDVAKGKERSHKGWTHKDHARPPKKSKPPITDTTKTYYGFVDPNGCPVVINNLAKFCRENNLFTSDMHKLKAGRIGRYKGWTYVDRT